MKVKRKGAYEYDLGWHQNHSCLVVAKAAEAALVRGEDIRTFIEGHDDVMDFMLRAKVPRSNRLMWGEEQIQNTSRYYVSTGGDLLHKVMPAKGTIGEYKRANKLTDQYFNEVMAEIGSGVWDERIHTKNKSMYEERRTDLNTGYTVQIMNDMKSLPAVADFNYDWYVIQAEKLVNPLLDC